MIDDFFFCLVTRFEESISEFSYSLVKNCSGLVGKIKKKFDDPFFSQTHPPTNISLHRTWPIVV